MADIAVAVALILVERVLPDFDKHGNLQKKVRSEVEEIRDWLKTMQAYLKDMEGNESNEGQKDRIDQIRDLAYRIENVLDKFMLHVPHRIYRHRLPNKAYEMCHDLAHRKALHEVASDIEEIKKKKDTIVDMDRIRAGNSVTSTEEGASSSSSMTPQILEADEIVGFEKPREDLIRQLTGGGGGGSSHLTISVDGPGGSGKTILVKGVYNSKEVQRHFDSHAWVHVSRSLKIKELINSMLKQIGVPDQDLIHREDVGIQAKVLGDYLHHKRYVVVLDDIWRIDDWERIKSVLPNGSSGSRIIVTTRNSDVASFCVESTDFKSTLDPLPWTEAWDLFCKKAFQTSRGKCPPELVEWSEKIVKRCDGLPCAIVAVGRWLSKKQQFPNEWKKLHGSLGTNDKYLSIVRSILLPSYKDLPAHLKCCFWYFSIFPDNYPIERGRLIRLWVAEGFVMKVRGKETPEEVAEDYLNQLIERNLVHVSKWDFDGRARSCRVRNLVLDFIVSMSEDESFVSILSEPNNKPLSSDKVRRLSIRNACTALSHRSRFSSVRSAFFFSWINFSTSHVGNVGDFKCLRVLDLQNAPLDKFPQGIDHLSLLRYLSLSHTNVKVVPKSIKKLSNLETLDLKQTFVTQLPANNIIPLVNLRHLLVNEKVSATTSNTVQGVELCAGIGALTSLQKLSLVKPDKHRKIIKELGALTQLRKLGLIELKRKDGKDLCASIQKMQSLLTLDLSSTNINEPLDLDDMPSPPPDLQRIYLKGHLEKFPRWISKLQNLFRIRLKGSGFQGSPLGALEDLPCLMDLELVDVSSSKELVLRAGKFRKLKTLHIEQFHQLHTVKVEKGAMPELQKLTLCRCSNLKMLLLGIKTLTHLKELRCYGTHEDFSALLEKTREDNRDMVTHIPVIHSLSTLGSLQNLSSFVLQANMESAMI